MKVLVDENLCTGCGICVDICPEVFEMADSVSVVKVADIGEDLKAQVEESVESCPVEAITVEG